MAIRLQQVAVPVQQIPRDNNSKAEWHTHNTNCTRRRKSAKRHHERKRLGYQSLPSPEQPRWKEWQGPRKKSEANRSVLLHPKNPQCWFPLRKKSSVHIRCSCVPGKKATCQKHQPVLHTWKAGWRWRGKEETGNGWWVRCARWHQRNAEVLEKVQVRVAGKVRQPRTLPTLLHVELCRHEMGWELRSNPQGEELRGYIHLETRQRKLHHWSYDQNGRWKGQKPQGLPGWRCRWILTRVHQKQRPRGHKVLQSQSQSVHTRSNARQKQSHECQLPHGENRVPRPWSRAHTWNTVAEAQQDWEASENCWW